MSLLLSGKEVTPGLDISHHQGSVNWDIVQNNGYKFVFLKASQNIHPDPLFSIHWTYLSKNPHGLLKAPYHFFDTSADPLTQADTFSFITGSLSPSDMPPVVDIEQDQTNGTLALADRIKNLQTFLTEIQKKTGRKPIIYTYNSFIKDYLQGSTVFNNYALWIASYPDPKQFKPSDPLPTTLPHLSCGWNDFKFWQYTENGFIDGGDDSGNVFDFNIFNGSFSDLQAFCANSIV